jgi:flagellar secretion chaperone FliS
MFAQRAARAYAQVGVETGVESASPHRLILMLYDGAIESLAEAQVHLAAGQVADKGRAVTKAIAIIDEGLRGSLDLTRGKLAAQLADLYDYMSRRLLLASVRNDASGFREVASLLVELRGAWAAIERPAQLGTSSARAVAR